MRSSGVQGGREGGPGEVVAGVRLVENGWNLFAAAYADRRHFALQRPLGPAHDLVVGADDELPDRALMADSKRGPVEGPRVDLGGIAVELGLEEEPCEGGLARVAVEVCDQGEVGVAQGAGVGRIGELGLDLPPEARGVVGGCYLVMSRSNSMTPSES